MCVEISEPDPACFFTAPGVAWQAALKKFKVKWDLLTNTDMLLIVGNSIRSRICHSIHWYAKLITDIWEIMIKIRIFVS